MTKFAIIAGVLVAMATPASAQMMHKPSKPMMHHHHTMKGPSMRQCRYGYKRSYMRSMHWSKAGFNKACHRMMIKHHK